MEEKILLEKEYSYDVEMLRSGCRAYQKKFVYPTAYIKAAVFLILAANFIYGIVTGPVDKGSGLLAYLLTMVCLGLAVIMLTNPMRQRRGITDGFLEMEPKPVYKLVVTEENVQISTVNLPDNDSENVPEETLPEETLYPRDDHLSTAEYDKFFLLIYAKLIYYIIPKDAFNEDEMEVIRNLKR